MNDLDRITDIIASGGLCSPESSYDPIPPRSKATFRQLFVEIGNRTLERSKLPSNELTAYDIDWRGYAEWGRPDVTVVLAEKRWYDEDADCDHEDIYEHVWDRPIQLRYAR